MSSKRSHKLIDEVYEECASANECTGLFQRIILDPDEVAKFHAMYNDLDDKTE